MNYTCPKCGKKMDLSTEVLINSDYKVICPQCLCELQIVGDYAYIPNETFDLDTSVEPSRTINCPKCGHEANSNAHFCPNCGTSFDNYTSSTADIDTVDAEDVTVLPPSLPQNDPLYNDAVQFLMTCPSITPMMLRDHFKISNERAAQLIRELEAGGVIGPYNNGGPRQILIPHRDFYGYIPRQQTMSGNSPRQTRQQPRRIGCVTWFIIIMFCLMIIKACGG